MSVRGTTAKRLNSQTGWVGCRWRQAATPNYTADTHTHIETYTQTHMHTLTHTGGGRSRLTVAIAEVKPQTAHSPSNQARNVLTGLCGEVVSPTQSPQSSYWPSRSEVKCCQVREEEGNETRCGRSFRGDRERGGGLGSIEESEGGDRRLPLYVCSKCWL